MIRKESFLGDPLIYFIFLVVLFAQNPKSNNNKIQNQTTNKVATTYACSFIKINCMLYCIVFRDIVYFLCKIIGITYFYIVTVFSMRPELTESTRIKTWSNNQNLKF